MTKEHMIDQTTKKEFMKERYDNGWIILLIVLLNVFVWGILPQLVG